MGRRIVLEVCDGLQSILFEEYKEKETKNVYECYVHYARKSVRKIIVIIKGFIFQVLFLRRRDITNVQAKKKCF